MNKLVFASLAALLVVAAVQVQCKPAYDSKYDNIDLDKVLESKRLVEGYVKCVLAEGPCTPDGSYLASILPDAINNGCAECNDKQKAGAKKAMQKLISDFPEQWKTLEGKWDPSGEKVKAFLA